MRNQVVELARHQERGRDFLRFDDIHELDGIPGGRQHDRRALQHRGTEPDEESRRMKKRRRRDDDIVRADAELLRGGNGGRVSRRVADQDSLGEAGRSAGQGDRKCIALLETCFGHVIGKTLDKIVNEREPVHIGHFIEQDQPRFLFELRQRFPDYWHERRFDNHDFCAYAVQNVGEFARNTSRRAMRRHVQRLSDGEIGDRVFGAIVRQDRHLGTFVEPQTE